MRQIIGFAVQYPIGFGWVDCGNNGGSGNAFRGVEGGGGGAGGGGGGGGGRGGGGGVGIGGGRSIQNREKFIIVRWRKKKIQCDVVHFCTVDDKRKIIIEPPIKKRHAVQKVTV